MSIENVAAPSLFSRFAAPAGTLLLTGIISVYALKGANSDTSPPPLADLPPAVTEPAAEFEAPSLPVRAHPSAAGRPVAGIDSATFPDLATGLAKLHAGTATAPVNVGDRDRLIADLDKRHASESIDPVWSSTQEQSLAAAAEAEVMARAGFTPQDVTSSCRSKSCRISARFENSSEARDWADRLLTQMAGTIGQARVAVLPQADGSFEVRVYGARRS